MKQKSIFLETFGDYPVYRVLDFFMVYEDFDYSMKQIAQNAGIGYATLKLFWKPLVEHGVVIKTRDIGNAKLYRLNLSNPMVKKFKAFYWEVTRQQVQEDIGQAVAVKVPSRKQAKKD